MELCLACTALSMFNVSIVYIQDPFRILESLEVASQVGSARSGTGSLLDGRIRQGMGRRIAAGTEMTHAYILQKQR